MPHPCKMAQYQQVSTFEEGRMVGLREAGLSHSDIAARTGHAVMSYECMEPVESKGSYADNSRYWTTCEHSMG